MCDGTADWALHEGEAGGVKRRTDAHEPLQRVRGASAPLWDTPRPYVLRVVVALPDHRLSLNRIKTHHGLRTKLVEAARHEAVFATFDADLPDVDRPIFPAGVALFMAFDVERRKRGQRWDTSGLIEAMKPYQDAWSGILYADDRQIVGYAVRWDQKPTGRGVVTVTIKEVDPSLAMYFGEPRP